MVGFAKTRGVRLAIGRYWVPLNQLRIESMSFPLPDDDAGPIDLDHLRRMTLGDAGLEREVLGMFARQACQLAATLATAPPEASALVHTLKGSARAIGAMRVAEAAAGLEAAIRDGEVPAQALGFLRDTVAEADAAIAALLRRS
jgi:HPt (histidine-containing phosphotransfer) domain-containing protein